MVHPNHDLARTLFGKRLGTGLANDDNMNLTGILHLVLDLLGNIMRKHGRLSIVDGIRLHHDTDLAAGLHGVRALDALVRIGDFLELLETLDVVLIALATCARTSGAYGIGGLDDDGEYEGSTSA